MPSKAKGSTFVAVYKYVYTSHTPATGCGKKFSRRDNLGQYMSSITCVQRPDVCQQTIPDANCASGAHRHQARYQLLHELRGRPVDCQGRVNEHRTMENVVGTC